MARSARHRAMDLLARREHGRVELTRKLTGKGVDAAEAEAAVDELADEGLQDDTRFAEGFVAARIGRGQGPVRIRVDLQKAGIDDALVDAALEAQAADWRALAAEALVKRFGTEPPADYREKTKRMRFLQRRGFEADTIRLAVEAGDAVD